MMTPADLARCGATLTGSPNRWRRPLARLLGVSEGFVRLMASGKRPVPERIERQLGELVAERQEALKRISRKSRRRG